MKAGSQCRTWPLVTSVDTVSQFEPSFVKSFVKCLHVGREFLHILQVCVVLKQRHVACQPHQSGFFLCCVLDAPLPMTARPNEFLPLAVQKVLEEFIVPLQWLSGP